MADFTHEQKTKLYKDFLKLKEALVKQDDANKVVHERFHNLKTLIPAENPIQMIENCLKQFGAWYVPAEE